MTTPIKSIKLKVAEAIQDDLYKGIIRFDTTFMHSLDIRPGDIVEIEGERKTVGIADRAYPGDIGLAIIRMDGLMRRNAKTGIGDIIQIRKAIVKDAKKIIIAPAKQGIIFKSDPIIFTQRLTGRPVTKGDMISLGGTKRRRDSISDPMFDDAFSKIFQNFDETLTNFGLGDLKFIVAETTPSKEAVRITAQTEIVINPEAIELKEEKELEVTYEDIGGLDEEVKKVREMVELPLKHPEIFERLGIEPPKGVLLHGSPGTGKTLLAKAVANETRSNFILINGPEIMSKYYGQSEENLRKKFEDAEKNAPSIIFIDEIDAIATKREEAKGEVERRVVAQLLALMDGLKSRGKVVVMAATNIPNQLDPALRRPGRFDREIEIGVPSKEGRLNILKIHTRTMPLVGSLHTDILKKILPESIKLELHEYDEKLKKDKEKLSDLKSRKSDLEKDLTRRNNEKKELETKLKELETKKARSDQTLLYRIIESIKLVTKSHKDLVDNITELEKTIASLNLELPALTKTIKELEHNIEKIKILKEKITNKDAINNLIDELEQLDKTNFKFNDPRAAIIKNKNNELQLLLELHLGGKIINEAKKSPEAIEKEIIHFAEITHGFVGADLASLAKESAMNLLRRLLPELRSKLKENEPIPKEILEELIITPQDFVDALKTVRPSALREVLIEIPNVKWDDIGGLDEVKQELKEAVEWPLKNPQAFRRLGIKPPKGVLIYGPPGTGKTMLAKAVANESEANFILIKGPELLSKWVGESERGVRKIFEKARQASPTIIFFDEIDAIAPRRGEASDNHVTERVVNQLLTEIDGLEEMHNIVIIGATNRPDILDTAMLRPGRFDRIVLAGVPDESTRKKIFEVHLKGIPIDKDVKVLELAKKTEGYVGADIEAVCREAAILALRKDMNIKTVKMEFFEEALKKVRPSVSRDVEEMYKTMKDQFSAAKGKEMLNDKPSYYG